MMLYAGGVIVGLSLVVGRVGGVVESSQLVTSATSGPLLGVFLLAVLVPMANAKVATFFYVIIYCKYGSLLNKIKL